MGTVDLDEKIKHNATSKVVTDVAVLMERVANLPSKGFITKVVLVALAFVTALFALQSQIQHFLGTATP